MNRLAGTIWQKYRDSGTLQDLSETLLGSGVTAGGQALFTDMTPEEIAVSTGLGAAAAIGIRPIGARAGFAGGRWIDKRVPDLGDIVERDPFINSMAVGSPGLIRHLEKTLPPGGAKDTLVGMNKAKYNQNFLKSDGSERGFAEGMSGFVGRQYSDNIAQGLVGIASPMILNSIQTGDEPVSI